MGRVRVQRRVHMGQSSNPRGLTSFPGISIELIVLSYTLLARKEERQMLAKFGDEYRDYQRRVPMFIPRSMGGQHPQEA